MLNWLKTLFSRKSEPAGNLEIKPEAKQLLEKPCRSCGSSGFLEPDDAMKLLMIGPEYTQVVIKTEKAARQLCWIRSEKIERIDEDTLKAEQDAFQEQFGKALSQIVGEEE